MLTSAVLGSLLVITLSAQLLPAGVAPAWLKAHQAVYGTIWPQGWTFFANAPDSETLSAYRLSSGPVARGSMLAMSMSGQNRWGLGRTAVAELSEAEYLANLVPGGYWISCTHPLAHSCLGAVRVYRLMNDFRPAMLCGLVAFVRAEPSATPPPITPGRSESVAVARLDCDV
jgi:hypothetical protein